jgi:hypothetical protein
VDIVKGGGGDDLISANDGHKDVIDCGKGEDTVSYDDNATVKDTVKNCEVKNPL